MHHCAAVTLHYPHGGGGKIAFIFPIHSKARDGQRRSLWEPSSKTRNNATLTASHAGIASNVQTSSSTIVSCEPRACPSVKRLKSFRFPAPPCKPGAYGMPPSIYAPKSPSSFKKVPDSLSYIG